AEEKNFVAAEHWCERVVVHDDEVCVLSAGVHEFGEFPLYLFAEEAFTIQHGVGHAQQYGVRGEQRKTKLGEPLGTRQMLSFRSLAFIRCSVIRRSRAFSCAALHSFPDPPKAMIIGRKSVKKSMRPATNSLRLPTRSRLANLL